MIKRVLFLFLFIQSAQQTMVEPKVEHHKRVTTQEYDEVTITCPEGYEGHYVDYGIGFDSSSQFTTNWGNPQPVGYIVCFDKKFMDKIRANPELQRMRPSPARPM